MRLVLLLLAALLAAAAAQPPAVARAAARSPVSMLALDLLPSPSFTIQSFDGTSRPASDDKLRAYCKVLHTRTPGVCFAAGEEGDFARSLCPAHCTQSASAAATRTLLAANAAEELKPCSQTADTSDMCSFFIEQADGACATAGFLSVYMRSECRKSCQFCTPDSAAEPPKAPAVERPPEPACDKAPDTGSACPFFFTNLVNPCSVATAGDAWIANYTSTQCQTSCGICRDGQQPAEPSPAAPQPSPSPEPATPSPSPASSGSSDCADLSTASFSCADVVKQELCGQPWAAGWCPKSCGYCDPEETPVNEQPAEAESPVVEQPAPASPAEQEEAAPSPVAEQPAPASPAEQEEAAPSPVAEQPAPASPAEQEEAAPSPVAEQPAPASPAEQAEAAPSPVAEQPAPASPAEQEEHEPAASPVGEEQEPSPASAEPSPLPSASPTAEEPAGDESPASPATEVPAPTSPVEEQQPASPAAEQPAPASPAAEQQQPAPTSPAAEQPAPTSPVAEQQQPAPGSPTTEVLEPAPSPTEEYPSPSPAVPTRPLPAGYGRSPAPGSYGASPAPSGPPASPPPTFEPRLTTAAVCEALACLTLPPAGDRLLTLPGIAACPATPCRSSTIECPSGCSAHGACHVAAGACVCFEGYEGADCASCAAGYERTSDSGCAKAMVVGKTAQAPAPIRPLFGDVPAAVGRHLMAASDDAATTAAVENQLVGSAGTEKLVLAVPSGWIAGAVVGAAFGMVAVAALIALRSRSSGGLPL